MACVSHLRKWVLCTFGCVFVFLEVIAWTPPRMEGRRIRMLRMERAGSPLHGFSGIPALPSGWSSSRGPSPAPGSPLTPSSVRSSSGPFLCVLSLGLLGDSSNFFHLLCYLLHCFSLLGLHNKVPQTGELNRNFSHNSGG